MVDYSEVIQGLEPIFKLNRFRPLKDQTSMDIDVVNSQINVVLMKESVKLANTFEGEHAKSTMDKLRTSVTSVINILDTITRPGQQYVFSGNSSALSKSFLEARLNAMKTRHKKIEQSLKKSVQLNGDENQLFRATGRSSKIFFNAIIIDEYANSMIKASETIGTPINLKKMVVFCTPNKLDMTSEAVNDLNRFLSENKFFTGLSDTSLVRFMQNITSVASTVNAINHSQEISHKHPNMMIKWDRNKLTKNQENSFRFAEQTLQSTNYKILEMLKQE